MNTELYAELGLDTNATDDEIKKAYKKLAMKYHPDRNKSPDAEEKFKKISNAHGILSDPEKKQTYDRFGMDGINSGMADGGMDPMADFFTNLHRGRSNIKKQKYNISLQDYFTKTQVKVPVSSDAPCKECDHTGFSDRQRRLCKGCHGTGMMMFTINRGPVIQQIQQICNMCNGKKFDVTNTKLHCKICNGAGTVKQVEEIDVDIPKNIISNSTVMMPGKGPIINGKNVDLAVVFNLKLSKGFAMASGGKLIYTMHINYPETLCGFRRIINHPCGKPILIVAEKGYVICPDHIYTIDNMGLDQDIMYLTFIIHYPENIVIPLRKVFNFDNLEMAMGKRKQPDDQDNNVDPENIYTLSTLQKVNNNPRSREDFDQQNDSDQESNDDQSEMPDFGHQAGCAQQ